MRRAGQAGEGGRLLGEHYGEERIEDLGLQVVTEDGQIVQPEEIQGNVFRFEDPDEPSGYLVSPTESTGIGTVLCYPQEAS